MKMRAKNIYKVQKHWEHYEIDKFKSLHNWV